MRRKGSFAVSGCRLVKYIYANHAFRLLRVINRSRAAALDYANSALPLPRAFYAFSYDLPGDVHLVRMATLENPT